MGSGGIANFLRVVLVERGLEEVGWQRVANSNIRPSVYKRKPTTPMLAARP